MQTKRQINELRVETWNKGITNTRCDEKKSKYAWCWKNKTNEETKKKQRSTNKNNAKLTIFDSIAPFGQFCPILLHIDAGLIAQSNQIDTKTCGQYFLCCSFVFDFRIFFFLFVSVSLCVCIFYRIQFDFCNSFAILIHSRLFLFSFIVENEIQH